MIEKNILLIYSLSKSNYVISCKCYLKCKSLTQIKKSTLCIELILNTLKLYKLSFKVIKCV